jgi:protein dithiol oxidoreductase (disulfide-forming)
MHKAAARFLPLAVLIALGACSKQEPAPQPTGPATPATAPATQPAAPTPAEKPEAQQPEAAAETAETAPGETITETEEAPQSAEPASTGVQPSLRLGSTAPSTPASERFKEGTHYRRIVPAQPTSLGPDKIEVVEAFWYGCDHCYSLEPAIEAWNAKKPHYVELVRVPSMGSETARMHARLFYTIEALGKVDPLHAQVFREIHVSGNPLNTIERITAFMKKNGVGAEEFNKAFSSFAVESRLQRADFLNRRYRIASVPMFIVNGKYTTDVGEAGGEQQMFALLGDLTAHEHGG